jgi:hypothetical protein
MLGGFSRRAQLREVTYEHNHHYRAGSRSGISPDLYSGSVYQALILSRVRMALSTGLWLGYLIY